ncbi:hypothetical protein Poly51_15480 [Rubripirellula tenax]|uniref:Uncharacterized protein n=1 Tax=Rubripirellula tenax TaxID=2528015 RepID=A0A5C6FBI9_9BACT|nr:hypothetical protein [Rubripirellula tenax]TWU58768.1 hypothetical protein Poly51_15480 [Rubripirellula tenax]
MSRWVWISIGIVALFGIRSYLLDRREAGVLNYRGQGEWIPIRDRDRVQEFADLGIRITLPDGWSMLARTVDERDLRPTFVNEASGCLLQLFPSEGSSVDPKGLDEASTNSRNDAPADSRDDAPPSIQTPNANIRWVRVSKTVNVEVPDGGGGKFPLAWNLTDPRQVGRWSMGDVEIGLVAVAHHNDPQAVTAIEQFCAGIEPLGG